MSSIKASRSIAGQKYKESTSKAPDINSDTMPSSATVVHSPGVDFDWRTFKSLLVQLLLSRIRLSRGTRDRMRNQDVRFLNRTKNIEGVLRGTDAVENCLSFRGGSISDELKKFAVLFVFILNLVIFPLQSHRGRLSLHSSVRALKVSVNAT